MGHNNLGRAVPLIAAAVALFAFAFLVRPSSAGSLTFSGRVTTPDGSTYTGGGNLNLFNASNGYGSGLDGAGNFSIIGIEPGIYTLDLGVPAGSGYANAPQQTVTVTGNVANFQVRAATAVLRGTLAAPDGTPTQGCVNVRDATYTINRGSCPDSTGAFVIGTLDAGTYVLDANPPENSAYVASQQSVTVTNPATTLNLGTVKLETPFIIGKVVYPNGSPLPWSDDWNQRVHLSVDLSNNDRTVDKHSGYDSQSRFKFGRVPAGTYTLHVNVWDTDQYTGSVNVTITVPAGGLDLTGSPVALSRPQLAGTVFRPDGSTPVANVWVNLHNSDWSQSQGSSTDQNGKYRIGGLPAGTYTLEVNPPQDMPDVVRPDQVEVTISAGLTTRNITLSAASKFVSGTVKKGDGTAVSCAQVNANRLGSSGWASAQTGSDGRYTLALQPGTWSLRVERSGDFACAAADWIFVDPEVVVDFGDSAATENQTANFTVRKATAIITGEVTKKDGTPVTNGNVNANSQTPDGRNRWSNAQISSSGAYKLYTTGGTYDLNVWTNDQRLYVRNQRVTVADTQTLTVNFVMGEKTASIKGLVTDKAGKALANIQLNGNLDCGPQGCSAWSNTTTAADGTYTMAVTGGRWFINLDGGRNQRYVYDGPQQDIYVETETATVTGVNFALTYADVLLRGKTVDTDGKGLTDLSGWVYVRPTNVTAGALFREFGGPLNGGTFSFYVPSSVYSQAEVGIHTPPNSQYSSKPNQLVTLVADATIDQNITVLKNDAALVGRVLDASGLPLKTCNFRGEVFANTPASWHGTQINPDCTYELSVLAGSYFVGSHIEESAGFLNRPPSNAQITIGSGTRKQYDVKVLAGDARVDVIVLKPNGEPARRTWVWIDNNEELDEQRRAAEEGRASDTFRGPGGADSPEKILEFCSKAENEQECRDFKLPPGSEGPGGCKDALACTRYCQKNRSECERFIKEDPTERTTAQGFRAQSVLNRRARLLSLKPVRATAEEQSAESTADPFANLIGTGGETNDKGAVSLSLLSGHRYMINVNTPPESDYLPPRNQTLDLTSSKSAQATLTLRDSDGRMTGFVTWNKVAVRNGWVGCWSEDGSSNGSPIINGTYRLNYSFNTSYHCNANASDGTTFLHSSEVLVNTGTRKSLTQHFTLDEAAFDLPPPVSESFDATQPHVITLADRTTINIPANALATSGTVTVDANPTINVQSQSTARPVGYGYALEAKDENNKTIATFNGNITLTFTYTQEMLDAAGVNEDSLVPGYWDSASGAWKKPNNVTQRKISDSADGVGSITTTTNHFTAYAVVSSGGKAGRNLVSVRTKNTRGGQQVIIGSGKSRVVVTPFKRYRDGLRVQTFTASAKLGQVIVAGPADATSFATSAKVYSVAGKLKQTVTPWGTGYRGGFNALDATDLTKDGYDDLILAPNRGSAAQVRDLNRRRTHNVAAGGTGAVNVAALDLGRGNRQLVTAVGSTVRAWQFGTKSFRSASFDQRRLRVTAQGIERVYLQPSISVVAPRSAARGKKVTLTITGQHFGSGSRVLINGTVAATKLKADGETKLTATFDLSSLKKGRHDVQVINPDGVQITRPKVLTVR